MINIIRYLKLSPTANAINTRAVNRDDFLTKFASVNYNERSALLSYYILNNEPLPFKNTPILYEKLIEYIADSLLLNSLEIKLVGSGKLGFSIVDGHLFGSNSDLDFAIVNGTLFSNLEDEFTRWSTGFENNIVIPKTQSEFKYWPENVKNGRTNLKRGFIDTNKIPNRDQYLHTIKINNSLSLIPRALFQTHSIKITKATVRIYKDWNSFKKQIELNTQIILKNSTLQ